MKCPTAAALLFSVVAAALTGASATAQAGGPLREQFIYDDADAPTPSCHASTLAETPHGLVAAWFGGTAEGNKDVGIWFAALQDGTWSTPVEVANGVQADGSRHPSWNPVLFHSATGGLLLFYKVGPTPRDWWGMLISSHDGGKTWSKPQRLPDGMLGPIKSKPVLLSDGTLLCGSSTEHDGWRVHMERTSDDGKTWSRTDPLNDAATWSAIQPTILDHGTAGLQILCRTKQRTIAESWSTDGGRSWSAMTATTLPNPNAGFDAVRLKDGRSLLIYNHTPKGRTPLNLAMSSDGKEWKNVATLESEPGEYSYPAIIQTADGLVHATYTWKRQRIKHVVIGPKPLGAAEARQE